MAQTPDPKPTPPSDEECMRATEEFLANGTIPTWYRINDDIADRFMNSVHTTKLWSEQRMFTLTVMAKRMWDNYRERDQKRLKELTEQNRTLTNAVSLLEDNVDRLQQQIDLVVHDNQELKKRCDASALLLQTHALHISELKKPVKKRKTEKETGTVTNRMKLKNCTILK